MAKETISDALTSIAFELQRLNGRLDDIIKIMNDHTKER